MDGESERVVFLVEVARSVDEGREKGAHEARRWLAGPWLRTMPLWDWVCFVTRPRDATCHFPFACETSTVNAGLCLTELTVP